MIPVAGEDLFGKKLRWIETALTERIAAHDAVKGLIGSFPNAVLFNYFFGILGAGRGKPAAMSEKRADSCLIKIDQ